MSVLIIQSEEDRQALQVAARKERKNLEREVSTAKDLWSKAVKLQEGNLPATEKNDLMSYANRNLNQKLRQQHEYVACWGRLF